MRIAHSSKKLSHSSRPHVYKFLIPSPHRRNLGSRQQWKKYCSVLLQSRVVDCKWYTKRVCMKINGNGNK